MAKISLKRLALIAFAGVLLGSAIYIIPVFFARPPQGLAGPDQLRTGGSSVVYFCMDRWCNGYKKEKKLKEDMDVYVDYVSTGSSAGITKMIDRTYEIGFTHAPMTDEQKKLAREKGGEVVHIPVAISAIVPIYNVKELKDAPPLNFTGEVLARIFLGDIKTWDHDAIKELNPDLLDKKTGKWKLPDTRIVVVHRDREKSSGSTLIFSEYLYDVSEAWRNKVGRPNDKIDWPVGEGKERSTDLASYVARNNGTIGYVEVLHARLNNIAYRAVENKDSMQKKEFKDKVFIHVMPEHVTAAAREIIRDIPDDLTFNLINKHGAKSYPICAAAWAVCYQQQPADREKMVVDFLQWVTHDGQKPAYRLWTHDSRNTKQIVTATVEKGAVSKIAIEGSVTGYEAPPRVMIRGGGGKGATATATVKNGYVDSISVTQGGTGYVSAPVVVLDPPEEVLFAPLPAELVERVERRLKTIKSSK